MAFRIRAKDGSTLWAHATWRDGAGRVTQYGADAVALHAAAHVDVAAHERHLPGRPRSRHGRHAHGAGTAAAGPGTRLAPLDRRRVLGRRRARAARRPARRTGLPRADGLRIRHEAVSAHSICNDPNDEHETMSKHHPQRHHPATPPPHRMARPRKGALAALKGLLPFLRPYRRQFLFAGIALLVAAGATLAIPYAFKQMIDHGFSASAGAPARPASTPRSSRCSAWPRCSRWRRRRVSTRCRGWASASRPTSAAPSTATSSERVPEFFETTRTGEVLSRLTTDTTLIQAVVGTSISLALRNTLLFVGGLAMLFVTSAKLTSIILGLLVLVVRADRAVRPARAQAVARFAGPHRRRVGAGRRDPQRHADGAGVHARKVSRRERFGTSVEGAFATAMRRIPPAPCSRCSPSRWCSAPSCSCCGWARTPCWKEP